MKSLTAKDKAEHARIVGELRDVEQELKDAIEWFNDALVDAYARFCDEVDGLYEKAFERISQEHCDDVAGDANDLAEDVYGQLDNYAGDRSERWHESEAGEAFSEWMQEWYIPELEIVLPEAPAFEEPMPIEMPDYRIDEFAELPLERGD